MSFVGKIIFLNLFAQKKKRDICKPQEETKHEWERGSCVVDD